MTDTSAGKPAHKYIRYNVKSPNGEKALHDMDIAFDSMKKMDCNNSIGWYYQVLCTGYLILYSTILFAPAMLTKDS